MARAKKAEIEKAAEHARAADAAAGEQLALLDDLAVADALNAAAAEQARRGRGRPPGARNRRTAEMLEYLETLGFEPPLLALAKRVAVDTKALARALRCSIKDAYDSQNQALVALLPYWHQRLPMAVDVEERRSIALTVQAIDVAGGEIEADYDTIMLGDLLVDDGSEGHAGTETHAEPHAEND